MSKFDVDARWVFIGMIVLGLLIAWVGYVETHHPQVQTPEPHILNNPTY